jgi:hypothetical protein
MAEENHINLVHANRVTYSESNKEISLIYIQPVNQANLILHQQWFYSLCKFVVGAKSIS